MNFKDFFLKHSFLTAAFLTYVGGMSCFPTQKKQTPQTVYKKDPIYLSLTTSPKRISKITQALDSIDKSLVSKIFLTLPERFGRNNKPYIIPENIKNYPKLEILRIGKDLGPITKLIPTVRHVRDILKEPNSIIVTIDDDINYGDREGDPVHETLVGSLVEELQTHERTIVGGSVADLNYWKIPINNWPDRNKKNRHIIEGFAAIAYRASYVDDILMLKIIQEQKEKTKSRTCFESDDFVISYVLALQGFHKKRLKETGIKNKISPLPYGNDEDALHLGGGLKDEIEKKDHDINKFKYPVCYKFILENIDRIVEETKPR